MRWGLVPSFAKRAEARYTVRGAALTSAAALDFDAFKGGSATFNARVEGAETSNLWRRLLDKRRCVVLFDGFYEWKTAGKTKQPMFIRNKDEYDGHSIPWPSKVDEEKEEGQSEGPQHAPLMLAGLYDTWQPEGEAEPLESVTILTMDPEHTVMEKASALDLTAKERCENWFLAYGVFWISCFAVIVGFGVYEHMAQWSYLIVCGGLAAPLLLQPVVCPWLTKEENLALQERYCTKANLWIAIYSFLGNYWGTHYFYCVLKAKYTLPFLPAHQLNGVPICMYLATHFYFSFYHALGNKVLRWVSTSFQPGTLRIIFTVLVVCCMSYVVAFLETFSISAFPYYSFEDRAQMYTIGSAFYAIYLVVSLPLFMRMDETPGGHSLAQAALEACGAWALILCLLDFVRLILGVELRMA
ncbi:unnamed protein product [Effrenium voratum]|nr:unnamed protein product [Effrenium voratum]